MQSRLSRIFKTPADTAQNAALGFPRQWLPSAQQAAGVIVGLAVEVPVIFHFDATVLVAMDFLAGRAGDDGGLAAQDLNTR